MRDTPTPRAYEMVASWVEERILAGELRVGDLLPAERDLAVQVGVSRSAVREAVRSLHAQGVLRSSVGAGATGGTRVCSMPSGALTRLLRIHVALANFPLEDVIEVRVALERLSARLAAARADEVDLDPLREQLRAMGEAGTREAFNDADAAFHVAIAEAAGNRLAADTTVAIRESVRAPLMELFSRLDEEAYAQLTRELDEEHEAIYRAIAVGDVAAAEALVESHVRTAWSRLHRGAGTMEA